MRARLAALLLLVAPPAAADAQKPQPDAATLARYDAWQRAAAAAVKLDWLLAKAVRIKESFNDAGYVSTTGAVGLMQLMPTSGGRMFLSRNYHRFVQARARREPSARWAAAYRRDLERLRDSLPLERLVQHDRRFDPRWNLERGTRHLAGELARFVRLYPRAGKAAHRRMTLAAYYAGAGRVRYRRGEVIVPSYVTPYVEDVLVVYGRLCAGLPGR